MRSQHCFYNCCEAYRPYINTLLPYTICKWMLEHSNACSASKEETDPEQTLSSYNLHQFG